MWLFSVQQTFILGTSYLSKPCWQISVVLHEHTHTVTTGNLMPSYEITQLFNRLFWNVSCRTIWELLGLAWTISMQHTQKKLDRHPKKAKCSLERYSSWWLSVWLPVHVGVSIFCLSLGVMKFDRKRSFTVCHILLKMSGRHCEDHCCPINIYSALLTSHFVEHSRADLDPNVN